MPTSLGQKRVIYWYTQEYKRSYKRLSQKLNFLSYPKYGLHPLFIGGEENPKTALVESRINFDPTAGRPVGWPLQECDQPPGRCSMLQSFVGLTGKTDRLVCQPIQWVSYLRYRSVDRCVPLYTSVGRPVDQSSVKEFKKLCCPCFWPSLYILHFGEDFQNLSQIPMNSGWSRHTISAWAIQEKLKHDLDKIDTRSRL